MLLMTCLVAVKPTTFKWSFQTRLGYVMPVNAELTIIRHNKLNADKHVLANCVARGHVVPFLKQLQQLLSLPEVHDSVYFSTNSSCDAASHMTDIHEGKVFESDDFFSDTSKRPAFWVIYR